MAILRTMPAMLITGLLLQAVPGSSTAQAAALAPHRAIYELTLDPSKTSSKIDKAGGRIAFEVTGNVCTGYSMSLRQVTQLDSGEGRQNTSDLRSITWESADGNSYRFKLQNYLNQELRDEVDGSAEREKDGALRVRLTKPKEDPFSIGGPVALPMEHLRKLIAAGAAGERLLEVRVYDGAPDGKKVYDTLAVVGDPTSGPIAGDDGSNATELVTTRRYPVTVSYFEADGVGERTPAYVLGYELYENGVSRALRLDYGGFALRGELSSIEFLKPVPCEH